MAAPHAALYALLALTCVCAEVYRVDDDLPNILHGRRSIEAAEVSEVRGCMSAGRWFAEGATVRTQDACLRCRCAHGALSCARAACAPAPDPPPRRCAVLHRRGVCCPELHCPDGVKTLELEATGRMEEDSWDVATPTAAGHACVEEGAVFAAGSALTARAACEQCFCLRGARRCVRPRCLPPPPNCTPRPAPGACCPSRYYCEKTSRNTTSTTPASLTTRVTPHQHDCQVNGQWVSEGDRVASAAASADNCTQCFCLRGAVRCQPLACAPALRGCEPLLRPGHCCPHQYHCPHRHSNDHLGLLAPIISTISDNSLISIKADERSFRKTSSTKSAFEARTAGSVSTTQRSLSSPPATTKVKRKTSDPPPNITSHKTSPKESKTPSTSSSKSTSTPTTSTSTATSPKATSKDTPSNTVATQEPVTAPTTQPVSSTETFTTAQSTEPTSTEQPEDSVRIIINGTINCTAELSSTLTNTTIINQADKIEEESKPQVPEKSSLEIQTTTLQPTEIITDRGVGAGFAEGDSFIINVTSSFNGNSSRPPVAPPVLTDMLKTSNMTKKTKEDYDYDYTEPTLPPSLPNLKIIPFVAADAVVDDDIPAKEEPLSYPIMEREDKFPVYYPTIEQEEIPYVTRREDVYNPTQYPVFVSGKENKNQLAELPSIVESKKPVTSPPTTTTTREQTVQTPEVNLFSPPAETEGGFIPKGPGIIDEYYAVYPSTPPPVPHLTTSMQINPDSPDRVECVTPDGRHVPDGESVWLACSVCACAWGELHCAPRRCPPPAPGCQRRPAAASNADLCCGEIVCKNDNTTTPASVSSTRRTEITLNETKVPVEIQSDIIPFDPPPDRRVPEPSNPTVLENEKEKEEKYQTNEATLITTTMQIPLNPSNSMPIGESKETLLPEISELPVSSDPSTTFSTTSTPILKVPEEKETNFTDSQSQEYEDDDDDEGFSFGSVLKLLLSDSYDSTTSSPVKKMSTATMTSPSPVTTTSRPPLPATRKSVPKPSIPTFIPVQPHAYIPPKKTFSQNTVNRIDHLVLGEATAIRKTTTRPVTTPFRPMSTPIRRFTTRTTTRKPIVTTRTTTKMTTVEEPTQYTSASSIETGRPSSFGGAGGGGAGLLKLAGCNIYGRMYRVGRIIAELSTPCQECRCTELGVQCLPLRC